MPKEFISPFKDAVCPEPAPKGDWGLQVGTPLPEAPSATADELQGGDTASTIAEAPAPGSQVNAKRIPGS
jgi:hypothetical protein